MRLHLQKLHQAFSQQFPGCSPTLAAIAPGRVNLLGEHTDYNDGFVLPLAIDTHFVLLGAPNDSNEVRLYSVDFEAQDSFSLHHVHLAQTNTWTNYIRGVCALLMEKGHTLSGMNIALHSDIPIGAGLSSSAALEVATALFVDAVNHLGKDKLELVKLAQKAENDFVGVNCGIMDQFVSMLGEEDHALFLDCRSLDYRTVSTQFEESGYALVVINSGVRRGLADSEYNLRRTQCEQAVKALQANLPEITALRDVTIDNLELVRALPEELAKRALHVVTENQRVLEAVEALQAKDLPTFGHLLQQSHISLRDHYEVSCYELDLLVEIALSVPATLGARMTGAGFGGSIISLTALDAVEELRNKIMLEYVKKTKIKPEIFMFKAARGAKLIEIG